MTDQPSGRARCGAFRASGPKCANPVTHKVTAGCIHEHVGDGHACDDHLPALAAGQGACVPCYRTDGHLCPVLVRIEFP